MEKLVRYVSSDSNVFPDRKVLSRPSPLMVDGVLEYAVQAILARRFVRGSAQYLTLWEGFPKEDATWEPLSHLVNAKRMVLAFDPSAIFPS